MPGVASSVVAVATDGVCGCCPIDVLCVWQCVSGDVSLTACQLYVTVAV